VKSIPAVLLLLGALAGEDGLCAADGGTAQTPAQAGERPLLGVNIDTSAGKFDAGVLVSSVVAGSSAAVIGILPNDLIVGINGTPITSMDDLKKVMDGLQVGSNVAIDVQRAGQKTQLTGQLLARPQPPESPHAAIVRLEAEIAELKRRQNHPPDLAETLDHVVQELNDLKRDLPRAAEDFKKQYPNGVFTVAIDVSISSDTTAKNPVTIGQGPKGDALAPVPAVAPVTPTTAPTTAPTPGPAPAPKP